MASPASDHAEQPGEQERGNKIDEGQKELEIRKQEPSKNSSVLGSGFRSEDHKIELGSYESSLRCINSGSEVPASNPDHAVSLKEVPTLKLKANLARQNNAAAWNEKLSWIMDDPQVTTQPILDRNNKTTTILHKALTSKEIENGCRITITEELLKANPSIAAIKNHHGSLPLHVAARNVLGNEETKVQIITLLIEAYPNALITGDNELRTPLHVCCEKFCSSRLAKLLIDAYPEAASVKDKKGLLPVHVACSRRCSPRKMKVLLDAYPDGIHHETDCGETPLSIAKKSATKQYPNHALIAFLEHKMISSNNAKCSGKQDWNNVSSLLPVKSIRNDTHNLHDERTYFRFGLKPPRTSGFPLESESRGVIQMKATYSLPSNEYKMANNDKVDKEQLVTRISGMKRKLDAISPVLLGPNYGGLSRLYCPVLRSDDASTLAGESYYLRRRTGCNSYPPTPEMRLERPVELASANGPFSLNWPIQHHSTARDILCPDSTLRDYLRIDPGSLLHVGSSSLSFDPYVNTGQMFRSL